MVDEFAAAIAYHKASPPVGVDADHIGMVRYEKEGDPSYDRVQKTLRRLETKLITPEAGA